MMIKIVLGFAKISQNNINLKIQILTIMRIAGKCLFLFLFIYSCSGNRNNFEISVDLSGSEGGYLYLAKLTLNGSVVVDSVLPRKSERYVFKGHTDMPDFYVIYKQPQHYINLIINPGDNFRVITENTSFDEHYQVEGSKDNRLIQKMVTEQIRTLEKITELTEAYESSLNKPSFEQIKPGIDSSYEAVIDAHRKFSISLIDENPGSLVSLMALYQQLGPKTAVFDYKKDFHYFAKVDSNLSALYPQLEAVIDLNRKITNLRDIQRLEIGAMAPDLTLPDIQGKPASLSALRGKNVLLVFWASWSDQSLTELRKISAMQQALTNRNIQYFGVSLDRTRESWLSSVKLFNVSGIQVCDFKYWDSPVVALYRIEKLPLIYLIDTRGVILFKNISAEEIPVIIQGMPVG
jgi:hypothetical protein